MTEYKIIRETSWQYFPKPELITKYYIKRRVKSFLFRLWHWEFIYVGYANKCLVYDNLKDAEKCIKMLRGKNGR